MDTVQRVQVNKLSAEDQRITDIQLVMREKNAMVAVGKELFALAKPYPEKIDEAAFRNKALELSIISPTSRDSVTVTRSTLFTEQ